MAKSADSLASFFWRHWEGLQEFGKERFSIIDNYSRFVKHNKPLPSWSSSDVEEFITSDPVYGTTLKTAREAKKFSEVGSVIGALPIVGFAWKYSTSLHGAALSFGAGVVSV